MGRWISAVAGSRRKPVSRLRLCLPAGSVKGRRVFGRAARAAFPFSRSDVDYRFRNSAVARRLPSSTMKGKTQRLRMGGALLPSLDHRSWKPASVVGVLVLSFVLRFRERVRPSGYSSDIFEEG
jgi:hypothetical protein